MKVDYIIVGCGLAGIAFCEQLRKHGKSFLVFDDGSQQSSKVAGGLFNPVVLKRFTTAWKAEELIGIALPFFYEVQKFLEVNFIQEAPVYRMFNSVEEQNNWFAASDKPMLSKLLFPEIIDNSNSNIRSEFGLGKVLRTGRIDTNVLIESYFERLISQDVLKNETFIYETLEVNEHSIQYKDLEVNHIVFTDGFGLKQNPYFNYLPLVGSKGEYIVVESPELKLENIVKGSVFIIPLENDTYLVGATYDNQDKTKMPTAKKKEELKMKLGKMIDCEFNVIDHFAAIRPTVKDRRPLVGTHSNYKNLSVLNGLGTRGVMASPYLAKQLFNHLESGDYLNSEIDIKRFENLFIN